MRRTACRGDSIQGEPSAHQIAVLLSASFFLEVAMKALPVTLFLVTVAACTAFLAIQRDWQLPFGTRTVAYHSPSDSHLAIQPPPVIPNLTDEMEQTRRKLDQLEEELRTIKKQAANSTDPTAGETPTNAKRVTDLPAQIEQTKQLYQALLNRQQQSQMASSLEVSPEVTAAFEAGHKLAEKEAEDQRERDKVKNFVMIGITVLLLVCSIAIVMLERYDANQKHWGYATLGTILGFWLR